jgi:hypothetical protein
MRKNLKLLLGTAILGVLLVAAIFAWAENQQKMIPSFIKPLDSNRTSGVIEQAKAQELARSIVAKFQPGAEISEGTLQEKLPGQRKVWSFKFGKQGWLDLDAETGEPLIYGYVDTEKQLMNAKTHKTTLGKEDLLELAKQEFQKLGVSWPGGEPETELITDLGGCSGIAEWRIKWPKLYKGYQFRGDTINATVDAYTGELLAYNNYWFSKAPPTLKVKVAKDEAREVAAKVLASSSSEVKDVEIEFPGELYIVNPNYRWREDREFIKYPPGETRLAWLFNFTLKRQFPETVYKQVGEIWIDAENKEVLGGVISP